VNINPRYTHNKKAEAAGHDISKISSSYILENIHDHYTVPEPTRQEDAEFSPMNPIKLDSRLVGKGTNKLRMLQKVSSCDFEDTGEGKTHR